MMQPIKKSIVAVSLVVASHAAEARILDMAAIDGPAVAPPRAVEIPLYGKKTPCKASDMSQTFSMGRERVLRNIDHGFGTGKPSTTTTLLIPQFLAWMDMQGIPTPRASV